MRPLLCLLAAVVAGCAIDAPTGPGCSPERPCGEEVVGGVNLTQLTRTPAGGEFDAVRARWAARTAAATGAAAPRLVSVAVLPSLLDGAETHVIAGVSREADTDTVFFAAARRPLRAPGDVARRPVVLVLPEAPGTMAADDLPAQTGLSSVVVDDVVIVGLAARGQALTAGGRTFRAAALPDAYAPDAYVADVDDAQTLAAGLASVEALANPNRLAAVGLGRGGTAALLMRARGAVTPSIDVDLAVAFGAPTSWFAESVVTGLRVRLAGTGSSPLPAFERVFESAVAPLQRGEIDLAEARLRLLERSPAPLLVAPSTAPAEIRVLAFYSALDGTVPLDHAGALVLGQTGAVETLDNVTRADLPTDLRVITTVTREMTARLGL